MAKVELESGGSIDIQLHGVDLFKMSREDREFVLGLVDTVRGYGKHNYAFHDASGFRVFGSAPVPFEGGQLLNPVQDVQGAPVAAGQTEAKESAGGETTAPPEGPADVPQGEAEPPTAPSPGSAKADGVTMPSSPATGRQPVVLAYLQKQSHPVTVTDIHMHLEFQGHHGLLPKDVRNTLNLLKQKGQAFNPERGMWQAAETGPPVETIALGPVEVDDEPDEPQGDVPAGTLSDLLQELRAKKDPPEGSAPRRQPFVPDPPAFRQDEEAERRAKELQDLERSTGQVVDALPLASGGPCMWHAGCPDKAEKVLPSYYGGRRIGEAELCRRHALTKAWADRMTPARAEAFAAEKKVG